MRTTVTLPDRLLRAAKRRAAERGVTVSAIVAEALQAQLSAVPVKPARFKLITAGRGGTFPGVNLDRTSELLEDDDLAIAGAHRGAR